MFVAKACIETESWGQDGTNCVKSEGRALQAERTGVPRSKDGKSQREEQADGGLHGELVSNGEALSHEGGRTYFIVEDIGESRKNPVT